MLSKLRAFFDRGGKTSRGKTLFHNTAALSVGRLGSKVLVFLLILNNRSIDMLATWLLVPYLIWLTFAVYLNIGVFLLN